jgi:hypothetical protein
LKKRFLAYFGLCSGQAIEAVNKGFGKKKFLNKFSASAILSYVFRNKYKKLWEKIRFFSNRSFSYRKLIASLAFCSLYYSEVRLKTRKIIDLLKLLFHK